MAERFFKVEVKKELITEIYLKFDDENPEFAYLKETKFPKLKREIIEIASEETIEDYEWNDYGISGYHVMSEVTKDESLKYKTWNVTNNDVC